MKLYRKMFLSPDGDAGGGTAVLDAPEVHEPPPMTPLGDVYAEALKKAKGKEQDAPEKAAEVPKPAHDKPAEKAATVEPPKSALEAALSVKVEPEKTTDDGEFSVKLSDLPEDLPNQNRGDNWKKARSGLEEREKALASLRSTSSKQISDLTAKIDQVKANPEATAKIKALEDKVAELTDGITAANIELLPEFRAKYIDGSKALINKAADKVKAYGGNPELLKEALALPEGTRRDTAIAEAMGEDVNDMARTKVNAIVTQLDDLNEAAQSDRANAQQSYERLTARQKEQLASQQQEMETRKQQTFETVSKKLQTTVPTLRLVDPSIPGAEEWNAPIKAAFDGVGELFNGNADPGRTVEVAVKGLRYDAVEKMFLDTRAELADARKQLAEYEGAQPDLRGSKGPAKTGKEAAIEKSPGQIYKETMAQLSNPEDQ